MGNILPLRSKLINWKMDSFIGKAQAKTDATGRVFVPANFRKILQSIEEQTVLLRRDVHQECMVLHPKKFWEEECKKLEERLIDWGDEKRLNTFRTISATAEYVDLDSNGRILIPKYFLHYAKITDTVCFVGMNKSIEIWNPDQFMKVMFNSDELKSNVRKFLSNSRRTGEKNDEQ